MEPEEAADNTTTQQQTMLNQIIERQVREDHCQNSLKMSKINCKCITFNLKCLKSIKMPKCSPRPGIAGTGAEAKQKWRRGW